MRARSRARGAAAAAAALACALLAGCGGGGSNPLDNPTTVVNTGAGTSGQNLSYAYFQACINPIFLEAIPTLSGGSTTNTCAGAGCHADATGAGGAFRVVPGAANTSVLKADAATIRASDMYKNFYSAQSEVVLGATTQSRLFDKPLLLNVLHGGGRIFADASDTHMQLIAFWITHPVPQGDDEFSTASASMFDSNGNCLK